MRFRLTKRAAGAALALSFVLPSMRADAANTRFVYSTSSSTTWWGSSQYPNLRGGQAFVEAQTYGRTYLESDYYTGAVYASTNAPNNGSYAYLSHPAITGREYCRKDTSQQVGLSCTVYFYW
jgi:hypothetical protein